MAVSLRGQMLLLGVCLFGKLPSDGHLSACLKSDLVDGPGHSTAVS